MSRKKEINIDSLKIKSESHNAFTDEINKIGLSSNGDKRV